ncbi:MAG TPA: hypothetical protein VFN97_27910 [Actinospica sp.]|nr:hypothetical protein [Actinospica sp.]
MLVGTDEHHAGHGPSVNPVLAATRLPMTYSRAVIVAALSVPTWCPRSAG